MILLCLVVLATGPDLSRAEQGVGGYRFEVPSEFELEAGARADLPMSIVPAEGFRVDENAPLRIDLAVGESSVLKVKKRRLQRADAVDPKSAAPRFASAIESTGEGRATLVIHYSFWLCRAKICRPQRGQAKVRVLVSAAAPPDAGVSDALP